MPSQVYMREMQLCWCVMCGLFAIPLVKHTVCIHDIAENLMEIEKSKSSVTTAIRLIGTI